MRFFKPSVFLLAVVSSFLFLISPALAQQPTPQKPAEKDDVIRIETNLVQTELMVFDKQGRFVNGLRPGQFELKINNKVQPISFLEQIRSGSPTEEAQREKAAGNPQPSTPKSSLPASESRRTIFFFIDDLHLSFTGFDRTRTMLNRFIDTEMNPGDQVVISCASGDIGFLQQFTNNKTMLKAAVGRLVHHPYIVRDMSHESVDMSEYMALTIERNEEPKVVTYFVEQCLLASPINYSRISCQAEVRNRARAILQQAASITVNTYNSFENLVDLAAQMPGRKLGFFVSDGFLMDAGPRSMSTQEWLRRVIDKARQAGVVVYTIDGKGLTSGALDASSKGAVDGNGRLENVLLREVAATQDALNAIAGDTGGRALRNQNVFDDWVSKILDETSNYYLLAWYFDGEEQDKESVKNIKVQIAGHPEYEVRLPRGFARSASIRSLLVRGGRQSEIEKPPEQEIRDALNAPLSRKGIPVSLSAVYLDTPENGLVLTASVQVENEALTYENDGGKRTAAVDLVGLLFDDKGKKAGSFQTRLNIDSLSEPASLARSDTIYNYRLPLKPGLYQVRIAARDGRGGNVGSATQWIELPDLRSKRLALSSLLVGVESIGANKPGDPAAAGAPQVQFSVDHNFSRNTPLRFVTFIYNASPSENGAAPDLDIQAHILRANRIIMTIPLRKVSAARQDPARIPYGDEIQLNSIPPGRYTLQIKVTDNAAKSETVQETDIVIR